MRNWDRFGVNYDVVSLRGNGTLGTKMDRRSSGAFHMVRVEIRVSRSRRGREKCILISPLSDRRLSYARTHEDVSSLKKRAGESRLVTGSPGWDNASMRPRVTYRIVLQQLSLINEELRRLGDRTRLIIAPGGNASVLKFLQLFQNYAKNAILIKRKIGGIEKKNFLSQKTCL